MAGCNYYPNKSDPSLFIKKAEPRSFVIIHVDDGEIIGTPNASKEIISAIGRSFKVKTLGEMENFVGCKILETGVLIHHQKLLKTLKESFKSII
jgi:hypothetical protein